MFKILGISYDLNNIAYYLLNKGKSIKGLILPLDGINSLPEKLKTILGKSKNVYIGVCNLSKGNTLEEKEMLVRYLNQIEIWLEENKYPYYTLVKAQIKDCSFRSKLSEAKAVALSLDWLIRENIVKKDDFIGL